MGWTNTLDRKSFDSKSTKPDPITIFGNPTAAGTMFQTGLNRMLMNPTRHHVIPHNLLIDCWNEAVVRSDMKLLQAFAVWAGKSASDLPTSFSLTTPEPQIVLRCVAWNPFNIIIGPLGEHRMGDPGPGFDHFEFRSFVPQGAPPASPTEAAQRQKESLARQEFNRHLGMLRRIYNLLTQYLIKPADNGANLAPQLMDSLVSLLRSDVPAHYPNLGPSFSTGALLSPDLWSAYTLLNAAPEPDFAKASKRAAKFARQTPVVVPWSSTSWLPEVDPIQPKPDLVDESDITVWAPGEATPPYDRLLLGKLALGIQTAIEFQAAVVKAARQTGKLRARVLLFGPRDGIANMARWTASAIKSLNREGCDFKISRTRFEHGTTEVRFYDFLHS